MGKYNYLRKKNFRIFVSFVAHEKNFLNIFVSFVANDFPVINYCQNDSLLSSIIRKQYQFALATGIHYPVKPAR